MLYRTNAQSRQIEEALRRYGRKYVVVGGFSFYQRAEVKDILAYLKVLVSPQDSISLLRIINTPARGIGRTTVEQIEQYALEHELSLWTALERMLEEHAFPPRAEAALAAFHRMMEELAAGVESRPVAETLRGCARTHRLPQDAGGGGHRGSAGAPGEPGRIAERRGRCVRARRNACAIFWTTPRWSPTPIRPTSAPRFRC